MGLLFMFNTALNADTQLRENVLRTTMHIAHHKRQTIQNTIILEQIQ